MTSLQDIRQGTETSGLEVMHLADETNHIQFIHVAEIADEEPFPRRCYECMDVHQWRRVWVKA